VDDIVIRWSDAQGNVRELGIGDAGIRIGIKKLSDDELAVLFKEIRRNVPFIIKRLVKAGDLYSIYLIFKGSMRAIFKKGPELDKNELLRVQASVLHINPKDLPMCSSIVNLVYAIIFKNQYNISTEKIQNKVIIDAGSNIGIFSIYAAKLGARRVYAFEPVTETYEQLRRTIELNKVTDAVVPINKALGDKNEIRDIEYSLTSIGAASLIYDNGVKSAHAQAVEITTIDDFMKDRGEVNFIKIDVEGYEERVLLGALKTMRKYKPIISFSAYHKPDDKNRLPEIVKQIRSDYMCKLLAFYEEVFHCE